MLMVILHTIFFAVISQTSFDFPTQVILFFIISFLMGLLVSTKGDDSK